MQSVVPTRVLALGVALALVTSLSGCAEDRSQPVKPATVRVEKQIGLHQLRFSVPHGWQHLDQGATQAFRNAGALLELQDLGTFSRLATIRHVEQAQDLYSKGESLAAQEHLKRLPYLQAAFLKAEDWLRVENSWRQLTQQQERARPKDINQAYEQVLSMLYQQPKSDLAAVAEMLLQLEDRSGQREVARQSELSIDGRKAVLIETWDRLSHSMQQPNLFVRNEGNILRLSVRLGSYDSVAEPFDQIARSLSFSTATVQ